jgi:tRNA dimethylallyltransferase
MRGIEHRLFGAWDGADPCSAADWAAAAKREIENAHLADAVPILVGGTGLYLRTLLDGIAPVPAIDPAVREAVRALPTPDAYTALQIEDPERAAALNPGDTARIARALEVVRSTGKPLTHWQAERVGGIGESVHLFPLILLPDRETLYRRCDVRFERMLESGAIEEVEALLARSLSPQLPVMRAIGVLEIAGWLRGELSRDETLGLGQIATRQYAKRQYTWFRRQPPERWPRIASKDSISLDLFETLFRYSGLT